MKNTMFFEHNANFLNHEGMLAMLASKQGPELLELAKNISVCLHEDWKNNLVREKGPEYQHFRPVKDAALEQDILNNPEKYLSQKSEDGKNLYRIVETKKEDGSSTFSAQFDLIRVSFENLSEKWQNANLDAAKFALCLVKSCIEKNGLEGSNLDVFNSFEGMSHDVHIEWMEREHSWADIRLLFPYEQLLVKSPANNEKDKDRAHVVAVSRELVMQPNILARNRSIVVRAIQEIFKTNAVESGLKPEVMKKIESVFPLIAEQNQADFARYEKFKGVMKQEITKILGTKTELTFEDLEKTAAVYYKFWKAQAQTVGALPKEYESSYDNLLADDERINFKNVARLEIADLVKEMVKNKELDEGLLEGANAVLSSDESTLIGQKIKQKNQEDVANYVQLLSQGQPE